MEINLKEYLLIIKKRLWLVIVCVLVATTLATLYNNTSYTPIYQASSKLIVNKTIANEEKNKKGNEEIDYGAIGTNIALINTFKEIIRSPAIMDVVVQKYPDLQMTAEQLVASVNVVDVTTTQVMTIVTRQLSHQKAVEIVNAVSEVFRSEIPKIMKVDNVTILNVAKIQEHPVPLNPKSNRNVILGFAVSLVFAIGIIFLLDALDDTLKTDEDIEQIFETSALAVIPKMKEKDLRSGKGNRLRGKAGETQYAKTIH
ncbi:YveK family protein [Paenibacillus eucommiae]|uniref:Capsular polysaccharide biosynthesis protein n=1 Tax=Paenibacillus eucommiae TaxID=1355755 RepID=A0ABS4IS90_9BACL|nr:Wzz/FepE/Etk N-terminal domain-containing protein [Paenibacillus eucommiae]MBP1990388.1 capsular polysaccharide biosynthesis protein [Paenibacillus eucommiae]